MSKPLKVSSSDLEEVVDQATASPGSSRSSAKVQVHVEEVGQLNAAPQAAPPKHSRSHKLQKHVAKESHAPLPL